MKESVLDVMKEIGTIGTGNAATSLSEMLGERIEISVPEVNILGFNEAVTFLGGAETIVAGILSQIYGEINGVILFTMEKEFINEMLKKLMDTEIDDSYNLGEIESSALVEIGNILISSFVIAISKFMDIKINLSVPVMSLNMLGGILSAPMAEAGMTSDKIMILKGNFIISNKELQSNLIVLPDVQSLNHLMDKLGVKNE